MADTARETAAREAFLDKLRGIGADEDTIEHARRNWKPLDDATPVAAADSLDPVGAALPVVAADSPVAGGSEPLQPGLREALERAGFALDLALGATYDDRTWLDEAMAASKQARAALANPLAATPAAGTRHDSASHVVRDEAWVRRTDDLGPLRRIAEGDLSGEGARDVARAAIADHGAVGRDEGLAALRELSEAASEGPWAWNSYSRIVSIPMCQRYNEAEALIPNDAPDDDPRWAALPETAACYVPSIERGDLATKQGAANAEYIVALVNWHRTALQSEDTP